MSLTVLSQWQHTGFHIPQMLTDGPWKKDSTLWQGMQKVATYCKTLLLFYHSSDWHNQQ